ncbi:hypothetical protein [Glycomyces sp. MUSA5-2]|uniref:hypothetical protein n=1 Tax=Glycomyces sp. MUSA5-2 TaxID=2053002 RepID=UPI003009D533
MTTPPLEPIDHFASAKVLQSALRFHADLPVVLVCVIRHRSAVTGGHWHSMPLLPGAEETRRALAEHRPGCAVEEFAYHCLHQAQTSEIKPIEGLIGIAVRYASTTIPVRLHAYRQRRYPPPEVPVTLDNAIYGHPGAVKRTEAWAAFIDGVHHHATWTGCDRLDRHPNWDVIPPLGHMTGQLMLRKDLQQLARIHAGLPVEGNIEP